MACNDCRFRLVCREMGFVISYDDYNPYSHMTEKHYVKSIDPTCPMKSFNFEQGYDKGFQDGVTATKERYATAVRGLIDDMG